MPEDKERKKAVFIAKSYRQGAGMLLYIPERSAKLAGAKPGDELMVSISVFRRGTGR